MDKIIKDFNPVVLTGENATVHNTIFLLENLLYQVDGNACVFSATRETLNKYLEDRIKQEKSNNGRLHKNKRIKVLKAVKSFVDDSYKTFGS